VKEDQEQQLREASEVRDLDPEEAFTLNDLQPAIQSEVGEPWQRGDYAGAVRTAWLALRDLLRDRLRESDLDGVDLVNAIGETSETPRLPLTDYVTETEKNTHRGLVQILRGIVFYARNPGAHETDNPVATNRPQALECLAMISLATRFVVAAAPPTAVEDALEELAEPRFPQTNAAVDDLVGGIPERRRGEFAEKIFQAAVDADRAGDSTLREKLAFAHRRVLRRSSWADDLVSAAALRCARLIARDDTLAIGMRLLDGPVFPKLEMRYQEKVSAMLQEIARTATLNEGRFPDDDLIETMDLFPRLETSAASAIYGSLLAGLNSDDPDRQVWVFIALVRIRGGLSKAQLAEVGTAVADAVAQKESGSLTDLVVELANAREDFAVEIREEILGGLRGYQGQTVAGSDQVDRALAALSPPSSTTVDLDSTQGS
jgi:uncharacterized protein (TIGR02391 family)